MGEIVWILNGWNSFQFQTSRMQSGGNLQNLGLGYLHAAPSVRSRECAAQIDGYLQISPHEWRRARLRRPSTPNPPNPAPFQSPREKGRKGEREIDGGGRRREQRRGRGRVLPAVLRGAQGQVRARVPRVRVPPRRQAPLRQQLQLQERHHDPQGGLRLPLRPPRGQEDHPGVRYHEGRRQQLAGARPHRPPGARDRHGQRAHFIHHLQDRLPRRCPVQQGPGGPPDLLLPRPGSEVFRVFTHQPPLQDQANSVLSSIPSLQCNCFMRLSVLRENFVPCNMLLSL